jgi:hypothetical protein
VLDSSPPIDVLLVSDQVENPPSSIPPPNHTRYHVMTRSSISILFLILLLSSLTSAQTISQYPLLFQGRLTDSTGVAIDTPSVSITFKLYKSDSPVWEEIHPAVEVKSGVFNVLLGVSTPLDTMPFYSPLDLGITVGADLEIAPRTPLVASAFAKALPGLYTFYAEDGTNNKSYNIIGGGSNNVLGAEVVGGTIGGGGGINDNLAVPNQVNHDFGVVAGGFSNTVTGSRGTVGGGTSNTASGFSATIGGGARSTAGGSFATVGGGENNSAGGYGAAIGGGRWNTTSDFSATVPGGEFNSARGQASLAAGHAAKAIHEGTFVWNDRSVVTDNDSLLSTGPNQFLIRAAGGVGIGTNSPSVGSQLDVAGPIHVGGNASGTLLYKRTDVVGNPTGDGIRFRYDGNYLGAGSDYLLIEKTDVNGLNPDGGIDFVNTGSDGVVQSALTIRGDGRVGVGTQSPLVKTHIESGDIALSAGSLLNEALVLEGGDTVIGIYSNQSGGYGSGVVLGEYGPGLVVPEFKSKWAMVRNTSSHSTTPNNLRFTYGTGTNYGVNETLVRFETGGNVRADGAFIGGGADVAESVDVTGSITRYTAGDVLVVSRLADRSFEHSSKPYSTLVAGIFATKPGVLLSRAGVDGSLDGQVPMAVIGIVPTKVTGENGPIEHGDLLVTSSKEGHAMKADRKRLDFGMVIGKALEDFDGHGDGMIDVLVNVK